MLDGELTVIVDGKETVLKSTISCFIGPDESREIINRGNEVCTILVAIAPPSEITHNGVVRRAWRGLATILQPSDGVDAGRRRA